MSLFTTLASKERIQALELYNLGEYRRSFEELLQIAHDFIQPVGCCIVFISECIKEEIRLGSLPDDLLARCTPVVLASKATQEEDFSGYPILTPDGFCIGVLGVFPKTQLGSREGKLLAHLSASITSELSGREAQLQREKSIEKESLLSTLSWADCLVWEADVDCTLEAWAWAFTIHPSGLFFRLFGERVPPPNVGLWYRFQIPEQAEMDERSRKAMLSGESTYTQEFRAIRGGVTNWIRETVTVKRKRDKKYWLIGVATDITSLKEMQEALKKSEIELAQARDEALGTSRLKSEFLANMSHEIRTPMNGVLGMLEILNTTHLTPEQKRMTDIISQSSKSLLKVLNDILDFSKIEAGKLAIHPEPFSLRDVVEEVAQLFTANAKSKGLELSVDIDQEVPDQVSGDHYRLRQVLNNIVGNAIKFTEAGAVSIQLRKLHASDSAVTVRLEVTDSGLGISEEQCLGLFQPFTQADGTYTRKYGGTGLGLAISKQLVELMGGSIGVTSKENSGSTFFVELSMPIVKMTVKSIVDEDIPSLPSGLRVLLVEDNQTNQIVATIQLNKLGCEVTCVSSGLDAIEILKTRTFDVILMDCQMPVMDGWRTTMYIRQSLSLNIPIIALTAHALEEQLQKCLDSGMNDCLTKPSSIEDLAFTIHRNLVRGLEAD